MKCRLEDICLKITDGSHYSPSDDFNSDIPMLSVKDMDEFDFNYNNCKHISEEEYNKMIRNDCVPKLYDVLVAKDGSYLKEIFVNEKETKKAILSSIAIFRLNQEIVDPYFLCYLLKTPIISNYVRDNCVSGSALPRIILRAFKEIKLTIPNLEIQKKIVEIVKNMNSKIRINNQINDNLEKQLSILFNEMFLENIKNNNTNEFEEKILYDVLEVIDNRGKTPKLVEISDYPILDVRALSGNGRIINYDMCEKYVDEEVYNTFFRSGHPKKNDILLSTVGSLAEMKLFIENKGTVAQNVIALRSKMDYPMFIYQYLKAIKSDLISYNIGSVQPSIKVTQFMKHSFYLPKSDKLKKFENLSVAYTNKMFNLHKEKEALTQLRDTLLPKLMNGEIDLDKIQI